MISPDNTEILTINYNTPDLVATLHTGIRTMIGRDYIFNIVDGSDKTGDEATKLDYIVNKDNCSTLHKLGYNIHHGPGMDYGIKLINKKYILIIDSDVILTSNKCLDAINQRLTSGFMHEDLDECFYGIGNVEYVNNSGLNVEKHKLGAIKYLHPRFMLINKKQYLRFSPFIRHGAPCIKAMVDIKNAGADRLLVESGDREVGWQHVGRSTRKRWGMNL